VNTAFALVAMLVALVSFALALAAVRRLRAVEGRLKEIMDPFGTDLPAPGTAVPPFEAVTTAGDRLSTVDLDLTEEVLVAFVSSDCESCRWDLPRLVTVLGALARSGPRPIVLLSGEESSRADIRGELEDVARVIADDPDRSLTKSFGVRGFPSLLRVREGTIVQSGHTLSEISLSPVA
jgi:peroxiredoxin